MLLYGRSSKFTQPDYSHLPPHDLGAEVMALGAAIAFPEARGKMADLKPSDFSRQEHGWIWAAIQHVPTVSVQTVCDELGDDLERFSAHGVTDGGRIYVEELAEQAFTHHGCEVYARDLMNCARLRRLIRFAGHLAQRSYEGHSAYSVVEYASDQIAALRTEWSPSRRGGVSI